MITIYYLISAPTYVYINKDTHNNGDYVTRLITENTDAWVDNDFIRYSVTNDSQFIPWDYANISRVNDRLFILDEGTLLFYLKQCAYAENMTSINNISK